MRQKKLLNFVSNSPDAKIAFLKNLAQVAGIVILMLLIYEKFCGILKQRKRIMDFYDANTERGG